MKINFRALGFLILAIIVAVAAFDMVRTRTIAGSQLSFTVNTGTVTLVNETDQPVSARITARGPFRVVSSDGDISLESTRQGTGRQATHVFEGELPPGTLELSLARGSDVTFTLTVEEGEIAATIFPRNQSETLTTVIVVALLLLSSIYYFSHSTGHVWLHSLRRRFLSRSPRPGLEASTSAE